MQVPYQRWSGRRYCEVDDIINEDKNMNELLNLTDTDRTWLRKKIDKASARIEKKIGMQDPNDETANELCCKLVYLDIATGTPIAEQRGTQNRISRMGLIPRLERDIRELYEILGRRPMVYWIEY